MTTARKGISVATLRTRADRARSTALSKYIDDARRHMTVDGILWAEPKWQGFGTFTNLAHTRTSSGRRKIYADIELLDPQFMDFAKAYIIERFSHHPGEHRSGSNARLGALRLVEAALKHLTDGSDPTHVDAAVLDHAARLAKQGFSGASVNYAGIYLQQLAQFLARKGIVPLDVGDWRHDLSVGQKGLAAGTEGDKFRSAKLPDQAALLALGAIFNRELDPSAKRDQRDIFTTSVTAMLLGAPSRGSQIFGLSEAPLHPSTTEDGREVVSMRVDPSKGFEPHNKPVLEMMVPAIELAVARIRAMSEEGRRLARHVEDPAKSNTFYRHAACPNVDDDEPLTADQACEALGLRNGGQSHAALGNAKLSGANGANTLRTLWVDWVLPRHRKNCPSFPYVEVGQRSRSKRGRLKYSDALFCMLKDQFHLGRNTSPVLLWHPSLPIFSADVCIHASALGTNNRNSPTIFERYGYLDKDGRPLGFKSHQARHILNTEAQRASLPDAVIARWSGRRDLSQNEVYDQMSTQERVEAARDIVEATAVTVGAVSNADSPSARRIGQWLVVTPPKPRSCSDLVDIEPSLTGLQTLYGECFHDYAASPCHGFVQCLECNEHVCVKDCDVLTHERRSRIGDLKVHAEQEVVKARLAIENGDWGADTWLELQQRRVAKLEQLVAILDDPAVPNGARVSVATARNPSHLVRAVRGIAQKSLERGELPKEVVGKLLLAVHSPAGTGERGEVRISRSVNLPRASKN